MRMPMGHSNPYLSMHLSARGEEASCSQLANPSLIESGGDLANET